MKMAGSGLSTVGLLCCVCVAAATVIRMEQSGSHGQAEEVPSAAPLTSTLPPLTFVNCPDKKTMCPPRNTCCKVSAHAFTYVEATGTAYACCPQEDAVCCFDRKSCCSKGYTCHTDKGKTTCVHADLKGALTQYPFLLNKYAKLVDEDGLQDLSAPQQDLGAWEQEQDIGAWELEQDRGCASSQTHADGFMCPNRKTMCAQGNTCCKAKAYGQYGCCRMNHAVCCGDGVHCCPAHMHCDLAKMMCYANSGPAQSGVVKMSGTE